MASPDSNAWYQIDILLYDNDVSPPSLQANNASGPPPGAPAYLGRFENVTGQFWQLYPSPASIRTSDPSYILRSKFLGPDWYLTAWQGCGSNQCGDFIPGMHNYSFNASAQWVYNPWGDGTYQFYTVALGDQLLLDAQSQSNPDAIILSRNKTDAGNASHWAITSLAEINDPSYSTAPAAFFFYSAPTTTTTTASSTSTSNPSTTSSTSPAMTGGVNQNGPGGGGGGAGTSSLSTGAKAGVGVGVGIAGLCVLLFFALLVFRRRGRRRRGVAQVYDLRDRYNAMHRDSDRAGSITPADWGGQDRTVSIEELDARARSPMELDGTHRISEVPTRGSTSR